MKNSGLRNLGQLLKQAFTCPDCGKPRIILATGHRGRGTGAKGAAHHDATSFESRSRETHCFCDEKKSADKAGQF